MSDRDVARAAVLRRVVKGEMNIREATPLLRVSYRQAKRLVQRFRRDGAKGLVHRSLGRSNRATPAAYRAHVVALIRAHYSGPAERGPGQRFGPTLTAEHLMREHGIAVPLMTLTRWMRAAELWGRTRRTKPRHARRERKAHFGELVQLDGSFHDWFEGRGPRPCAMTMVDDATSTTLLRFSEEETTWGAAELLQAWIAQYGVPLALYADWKNVYQRAPTNNELARGTAPLTQFGRMCEKLDIRLIGAASPQAKGRVERGHGTHQDRLVKKLRRAQIHDMAAANAYVIAHYLPDHNRRFAIAAARPVDYHRPRDRQRWADADVFCLETSRVIGNDYVVQYQTQALQLDRRTRGRIPAQSRVVVRELRDGTLRVVYRASDGRERVLPWTPAAARAPKPRPLVSIPKPELEPLTPRSKPTPPHPGPDHPWRRQHRAWKKQALAERAQKEIHRTPRTANTDAGKTVNTTTNSQQPIP